MNCNDIRKYFYAFIDNELDVEKNIEILAHIDMCYECSQKIERERFLHNRVKETVSVVKAPVYLKNTILEMAETKPNFFTLFKENLLLKSRLLPLAGIATAIILIVCFIVIPGNLHVCCWSLLSNIEVTIVSFYLVEITIHHYHSHLYMDFLLYRC